MYLGRIVERASVEEIFYNPKHPYTIAVALDPAVRDGRGAPLEVIRGAVPDPYSRVPGCSFHPRCPDFIGDVCQTVIPPEKLLPARTRHGVRCHLYDDERRAGRLDGGGGAMTERSGPSARRGPSANASGAVPREPAEGPYCSRSGA